MTSVFSVALMGLFVWTGASTSPTILSVQSPILATTTEKAITVRLTGYNAVPEQTDSNPDVTATGAVSNPEVIAARSRDLADVLPFGTVIALEAPVASDSCGFSIVQHLIGYRVIADSMHERKHNQVDVMFDPSDTVQIGVSGKAPKATNPAVALGVCNVTIRVVGKIALKDIPATQTSLALLVNHTFAMR